MNNPLFGMLGGNSQGNNTMGMIGQFKKFMSEMKGKDPRQELNSLLQSGKISQDQLNQAQQMASQMRGMFDSIK